MKCLYLIANLPVYVFSLMPIDSRMYCLIHNHHGLIIDPFISPDIEKLLLQSSIDKILILLTHEHIDHISGVNWLRSLYDCQVLCTKKCAERIEDPRKNAAAYFDVMFCLHKESEQKAIRHLNLKNYTCESDIAFDRYLEFRWNDLSVKCIALPGHSPGSMCISINEKYIFTGDSLIPEQNIITRLPGGSKSDYQKYVKPFLQNILSTYPNSVIFPGHGDSGYLSNKEFHDYL